MAISPTDLKKYGDQIASWLTTHAGMKQTGDTLESLVTIFKTTDYKKRNQLLPALDGTPFKHPLDTRFFSPKITTRLATIRTQVDGALLLLKIGPGHPQYCDRFVRGFYEAALPQYDDGGLCLGYPKDILSRYPNGDYTKDPELTAKEAFDGCLNKSLPYGACTETTYKIISAIEKATDGVCHVDAIETEDHAYARFRGSATTFDMDPVGLRSQGWEATVNPVAMYYSMLTDITHDLFTNKIAHTLEPVTHPDRSPQYNDDGTFKTTIKLKDCLAFLDNWIPYVKAHPQALLPFVMFNKMLKNFSPAAAEVLALAYLDRFPDNPHAGLPLLQLERSEAETFRLAKEVYAKYPTTGWGPVLMAKFYTRNNRHAEAAIWISLGEWITRWKSTPTIRTKVPSEL